MRASVACCGGPTVSESKDFYGILGLDPGASAESIKLAYRRLAREKHPDMVQHLGAAAQAEASAAMLAINEAYSTLSNVKARQEYDAILLGRATPASAPEAQSAPAAQAAAAPAPSRTRARPGAEVQSSVVEVFSNHLRADLVAKVKDLKWRERQIEGFHLAMSASVWTAEYIVALRGFAAADLNSAAKFTTYCDLAMERHKGALKQTYFLFFFAYQKASNTDMIMATLRRFCGDTEERTPAPMMIVLTDVVRGKALLCGPPVTERRYEQMLKALRLK